MTVAALEADGIPSVTQKWAPGGAEQHDKVANVSRGGIVYKIWWDDRYLTTSRSYRLVGTDKIMIR